MTPEQRMRFRQHEAGLLGADSRDHSPRAVGLGLIAVGVTVFLAVFAALVAWSAFDRWAYPYDYPLTIEDTE